MAIIDFIVYVFVITVAVLPHFCVIHVSSGSCHYLRAFEFVLENLCRSKYQFSMSYIVTFLSSPMMVYQYCAGRSETF